MNLKPIELWRQDTVARENFLRFVASPLFKNGLTTALAYLQEKVCTQAEGAAMMRGANFLSDILLTMANVPRETESPRFDLPHPETDLGGKIKPKH